LSLFFWLKQAVGVVATPLMAGAILVVAGAVLRRCGRARPAALLWIIAAGLLYLCATAPLSSALLRPLETRYAALGDVPQPAARYVVVLGSGYAPRSGVPVTGALEADGLARITEGLRILRLAPNARLLVSGGRVQEREPSADGYARLAVALGVAPSAIIKLDTPRDTAEETRQIAALVGSDPFILVTSAYHMPRAMRLMARAGLHPLAAPTGQLALNRGWGGWLPRAGNLIKTDRALHEYLGLAIER
jgi:uncharacterized SAM-binding protein YcdF (DUF218 family)